MACGSRARMRAIRSDSFLPKIKLENGLGGVPAGRGLLLGGKLLIGIAPGADLQTPANPAEIFVLGGVRSGQRRARGSTNRAAAGNDSPVDFYRLFRHLQNSRRDDGLGDRFLFHFCFHYSLISSISACRYYEGSRTGKTLGQFHEQICIFVSRSGVSVDRNGQSISRPVSGRAAGV